MPASHITKIYAVEDAKIAAVTADSVGVYTTGTAQDVPGIKSVAMTPNINTVELRGDNTQLDTGSTLTSVGLSFSHAKLSLDNLSILVGGAIVDSGTGTTEVATYTRLSTHAFSDFRFQAKTPTGGGDHPGSDVQMTFYKCKVTGWSLGFAEEDYQVISFEATAVARLSDLKLFDIVVNETAVALPA